MSRVVNAVSLSKVYKGRNYQSVEALREIDLHMKQGEFLGISGPSGSGKTTLLNIIGTIDRPTSGTLELFGRRVDTMNDRELSKIRLRQIGFIFQEHNLLPSLTVAENIELPMSLAAVTAHQRKERVQELLQIVGLESLATRLPGELSMGQRQRIAALRAFANNPQMILGDEPTSELDRKNASILLDFLKEVNKQHGTAIIITTTNPERFKGFISRHLRLVDGRLMSPN